MQTTTKTIYCFVSFFVLIILFCLFSPYDIWSFDVVRQVVKNIYIFILMKRNDREWTVDTRTPGSVGVSKRGEERVCIMWPMLMTMMISDRTFRSPQVKNIYLYLKRNIHVSESRAEQHTHTHTVQPEIWFVCAAYYGLNNVMVKKCFRMAFYRSPEN